ncbi:MAG: glycosyltransferase family 4 protein [Planctomycetota bacterium]
MGDRRACTPVFVLPQGLTVTGVNTWALSLVERGDARAIVHGAHPSHSAFDTTAPGLVHLDAHAADPESLSNEYRAVFERIARESGVPVAPIPTRHDGCFAAIAAIVRDTPDLVRPILWQQNDSRYEDVLIEHFEPMASALVGASEHLGRSITYRVPHRAGDTLVIYNAVRVPARAPSREPTTGRPLRLVYAGRVEHEQKRAGALVPMSEELARRGIAHHLRIIGDGPAINDVHAQAERHVHVELVGPVASQDVEAHLCWADIFVLCSRHEGLSFALLEAMAAGCVPVMTRTRSGADEAVVDNVSGVLIDAPDDDAGTALAMAGGVQRAQRLGLGKLSNEAHGRMRERFDLETHARALGSLCEHLAQTPARAWPSERPLSARDPGVIRRRAEALIERAFGSQPRGRFVVHGVGAHTRALEPLLRAHAASIVAFTDDDPGSWGRTLLGKPIVQPSEAHACRATDVLISSDLHEESIWHRREAYELQGLRVHRLYDAQMPLRAAH